MLKKYISFLFLSSGVIILLSLSYWQVQRLQWKNDIIDRLTVEHQKDPQKNEFSFDTLLSFENEKLPIRFGQVTGNFVYDKEILVGPKPYDGKIGYHVITPLKVEHNGFVFVNRGWVEEGKKETIKNKQPQSQITVSGIFRKPDWNRFTPDNSPANNIWTKLDIEQIAQKKQITPIVPVMLYASNISVNFDPIILQDQKWYPRNKHLQYAIFWATMALALIIVFGIFIGKNKKGAA